MLSNKNGLHRRLSVLQLSGSFYIKLSIVYQILRILQASDCNQIALVEMCMLHF